MSTLLSKASGNFTDATATWGLVDSTSYLNAENAGELLTTAYSGTRSSAFTPGAITIDGIAVKMADRYNTTGTISIHLILSSDNSEVAGTEVTIDCSDLPDCLTTDANGGWVFFKFAGNVTLSAATAYKVEAATSSATQVYLFRDATVDNICRALRTTTEQAPAAGDDLIICKQWTGAGSSTAVTITMDSTAATDYGAASTSLATPAIAICDGGTLSFGTTAATDYVLRVSGNVIVYSGGTLNIGTTGTPVPRGSTAVLEFDCAADGDFGLTVRNLGTCNMQGLSRTSAKDIYWCLLNTDEAAASTVLGVDTDTGWLDGDVIAIAPTSRTASEHESATLSGNAGASSITIAAGLTNAHAGTAPTQAEVILLTRSVKVRSVSSTAVSYVNTKEAATVDWDWVEFYYLGENAGSKRSIEIWGTTAGSFSAQYCSVHDTEDYGVYISAGNSAVLGNITYSKNVHYLANTLAGGGGLALAQGGAVPTAMDTVVLDDLIFIGSVGTTGSGTSSVQVSIMPGSMRNLRVSGNTTGAGVGFSYPGSGGSDATLAGDFSGLVSHSNAGMGLVAVTNWAPAFKADTVSIWRNNGVGWNISTVVSAVIGTLTTFGNTGQNLLCTSWAVELDIGVWNSNGDSSFATTNALVLGTTNRIAGHVGKLKVGKFVSTASGILTAHTNDFSFLHSMCHLQFECGTFDFGSTVPFLNAPANISPRSYLATQKYDGTSGDNRTLFKYAEAKMDTTVYDAAPASMRVVPVDAAIRQEVPIGKVTVNSGGTRTVSLKVRASEFTANGADYAGYGTEYPKLIAKANYAVGLTADLVIDTMTTAYLPGGASEATWETLTGTLSADAAANFSEDGQIELVVSCLGTAGWINVDTLAVS